MTESEKVLGLGEKQICQNDQLEIFNGYIVVLQR